MIGTAHNQRGWTFAFPKFNLWMWFLFLIIVPIYLNFTTFYKNLLVTIILWLSCILVITQEYILCFLLEGPPDYCIIQNVINCYSSRETWVSETYYQTFQWAPVFYIYMLSIISCQHIQQCITMLFYVILITTVTSLLLHWKQFSGLASYL